MTAFVVAAMLAVTVTVTVAAAPACQPSETETDPWVVESVNYHGSRGDNGPGGKGTHYLICIRQSELSLDYTAREHRREVVIPAERANDGTYMHEGTPCPAGRAPNF